MLKNVKWLIPIIVLSIACNKSFDERIFNSIMDSCIDYDVGNCLFDLDEFTDFDWDYVYFFGELTYSNEINQTLGFHCNCNLVPDNYNRVVFVKDNSIIFSEDFHSLAKIQFRELNFPSEDVISYNNSEAKFIVLKKKEVDGRVFFDLYPNNSTLMPKYIKNRAE